MIKIYLLLGVPVIGELDPSTIHERNLVCEHCNNTVLTMENITYLFDRWNGQDFIAGFAEYFVSKRLKDALIKENIKGVEFKKIKTGFSQKITTEKIGQNAYQNMLPDFYHMKIIGKARGNPKTWFKFLSKCDVCTTEKWLMDDGYVHSSGNPEAIGKDIEKPVPRDVYYSSWKEDDFFLTQDRYPPPFVTQKVIDVLKSLNVVLNNKGGVWIRPINWILKNETTNS